MGTRGILSHDQFSLFTGDSAASACIAIPARHVSLSLGHDAVGQLVMGSCRILPAIPRRAVAACPFDLLFIKTRNRFRFRTSDGTKVIFSINLGGTLV